VSDTENTLPEEQHSTSHEASKRVPRSYHPVVLVLIGVVSSLVVVFGVLTLAHAWGDHHEGKRYGHEYGMRGEHDRRGDGPRGMMERGPRMHGRGGERPEIMRDALASLGVTDKELADALTKQISKLEKAGDITERQADFMRDHVAEELSDNVQKQSAP
jgi:hypothetical protein